MIRSKDIQTARKEIASFRRKVKTTQADIIRAWEIAKTAPITESENHILEQKEKRFRSLKRKLANMEENLKSLQEGQEPARVASCRVRRPSTEARLLSFCEA